jgi:hypothetical protein
MPVSQACTGGLPGIDGEFLDNRVREQLPGQFGDAIRRHGLSQLDLEPLALADAGDLAEAETTARAGDCLTLGVVDLGLQHDVDDESRHIPNSTRTVLANTGRDTCRLAVALK